MFNKLIPIRYSGFWDVPSAFFTEYNSEIYFFYRDYFDEELDDYPPNYEVYIYKDISIHEAIEEKLWHPRDFENKKFIGEIPTIDVIFDETKRKFVNTNVFGKIKVPELR